MNQASSMPLPPTEKYRPFAPYYAGWRRRHWDVMRMKISSKGQVTLPARVREALGVERGDHVEIVDTPAGLLLRKHGFDPTRLAPLQDHVTRSPSDPTYLMMRHETHDPALRD